MSDPSREAVREVWKDAAARWKRDYPSHAVQSRAATELIIAAAGVKPGMRVLDLATGTGQPALSIARAVGEAGEVIATDLVPEMLSVAEENARDEGIENVRFEVVGAENLEFADESFDVVTCRFGIMFFSDVARAVSEARRVLRPGGRAAYLSWAEIEESPSWSPLRILTGKAIEDGMPRAAMEGLLIPFRFADPKELEEALAPGRFSETRVDTHRIPWPSRMSSEQLFDRALEQPALHQIYESLPEPEREEARLEVSAAFAPYQEGELMNFDALVNLAVGTR